MSTETLIGKYPLKREKIIKKTLGLFVGIGIGGLILFLVVAAFLFEIIGPLTTILLGAFLVLGLAAAVYWYESEYYRKYFYDLTEEGIVVSKGVFTTHRVIVPPNKVQDVYLDQDVLDRVFGLWDLHISSATETSGTEAHIDGVSQENASALREILMKALLPEKETKTSDTAASPTSSDLQRGGALLKEIRPSGMGLVEIIIGGIVGFVLLVAFMGPFGLLLLLLLPFVLLWSYLDFTVLRYELREEGVFIRSGFITRSERLFLYKNIQDVEERAMIWDQILGLKALSIKTMTASSTISANMSYLNASIAPGLRDEIIASAKKESQKAEKRAKAERPAIASIAAGMPSLAMGAEPEKERPKIEERERPYPNNFYKGATYLVIVYGGCFAIITILIALVLLLFGHWGIAVLGAGAAILITLLFAGFTFVSAFIMVISYVYTISSDFVLIKTGIFNIIKKQINYNKIQDVEIRIGFSQSFAKLATLKLETGSKEAVGKGHAQSSITQNEVIPDLHSGDAEELRQIVLDQMRFSYKGIGAAPLVKRIPLEAIKPLKKTFWWIFYSILALGAVGIGTLFGLPVFVLGVLLLFLGSACILKYAYEYEYYKRYFYDLNDDILVIKKGVFGSRELMVPFEKIQDVFIDRDWLDLAFGLYDVYVTTVSSRSILNAHIDGVNGKNAEAVAELLMRKIKA
ncbi:MAG: PH domain-containing protein [Candidatus Micrarchaeota archaeon]